MLLAKTFTMPVSLVKQMFTVVTSERLFIPRSNPATSSSTFQLTGPVNTVSGSQVQSVTGSIVLALQPFGSISQPVSTSKTVAVPSEMSLARSASQVTKSQTATSSSDLPNL